jgi:hypothetical protein
LSVYTPIRKVVAGLLLVVFAFGITPKRTLHNLVADHRDGKAVAVTHDHSGQELSKAAFNCQCENLISESPFVSESYTVRSVSPVYFTSYTHGTVEEPYSSELFCFGLRGPPVC